MEPLLLNIDLLPVNIAIYKKENDDFTFLAFNKSAEKTENIDRNHLLGRKLTEVFPGVKKFGLYDVLLLVYIDLHHGHIGAENHPDGGAVFSFIIPVE